MSKGKKSNKFVSIIFSLIGLPFFLFGLYWLYNTFVFMENAVTTIGTVTHVQVNHSDDSTTYTPTVRYFDENGSKHISRSGLSSSSYNYGIGQEIEVLYDRRDPSTMRINSWIETWGFGLIFSFMGFVFMVIGWFIRPNKAGFAVNNQSSSERAMREKYVRLPSRETPEDHARETSYRPTVRR